jgi:hypothetical protein
MQTILHTRASDLPGSCLASRRSQHTVRTVIGFGVLLVAGALLSGCGTSHQPRAMGSDLDRLYGAWTGTLTYRDYTSNQETSIPAELNVVVGAMPGDKPDSQFRVVSIMRRYPLEPQANNAETSELSRDGRRLGDERVVSRLEPAPGIVIFETRERGSDNDKPALLRQTYTITPEMFVSSKDVWNPTAKTFENRNVARFTRSDMVASGAASLSTAGLELPDAAKPVEALQPLAFMAGHWVCVNKNKTVNDELWTPPRGSSMAALFRQVRRDGKPAFHEASLITADESGVTLRLRHMHAALEVPEERKELSIFKLVSAGGNRAEFAGTGSAEEVQRVVYSLDGPDTLVVEVGFAPTSKEKGYTMRYSRVR